MTRFYRKLHMVMICFILLITGLLFSPVPSEAASDDVVYVIPVKQGIERGLHQFLKRAFFEAEEGEADAILLEVDTPGGEVGAAGDIGELIRTSSIPVTAYVVDEAFSAGTYISLNADQIVMRPGSALGSAAPIDLSGNMASKKVVSAWSKKMVAAAQLNDRDPKIAKAMVDPDMAIPGLVKKGEILSLSARESLEYGYADGMAETRAEALAHMGNEGATLIFEELTMGEKIARFVTHPLVMPVLLTIGLIGIVLELLIPGFGIAGLIGVGSFGLYFFGHYLAGYANWLHVLLFILGIILMLIELVVPGFGIFGGLGILSLVAGVVMAAYDTGAGLLSFGIAFVIAIVFIIIVIKQFKTRGIWNRFILKDEMKTESGYVAPRGYQHLQGKQGVALTPLRPSGMAEIEGERVDVVTEGGHTASGQQVSVVKVEGNRVVVREVKQNKEESEKE